MHCDRMSVAEARGWLPMAESHDVNANISRLLRTAISQAEQIERLQRAVNYAIKYSLDDAVDLAIDGVLHPDDMETPA